MLKETVKDAIDEIADHFSGQKLSVQADGQGGAFVIVESVPLGPPYKQDTTWVGFHITHSCPFADTYPHFVRGDLERVDSAGPSAGMSGNVQFPAQRGTGDDAIAPRSAVQLSRRSNRRDGEGLETPLLKLLKVMRWLLSL